MPDMNVRVSIVSVALLLLLGARLEAQPVVIVDARLMESNTPCLSFHVFVEETGKTFRGSMYAPACCQLPAPGLYHLHVRGGLEHETEELQVVASSMNETLRVTACLQWMSEAAQPYAVAWPDTILAYHRYLRTLADAGSGTHIRLDSASWTGPQDVLCSVSIINPTDVPVRFINPWNYGFWEAELEKTTGEIIWRGGDTDLRRNPNWTYHLELHSFEIPARDSLTGIELRLPVQLPESFPTDEARLAVRHVWPKQDTLWLWRETIDRSHPGYMQMANRNLYFIWYIYQGTPQSNSLPLRRIRRYVPPTRRSSGSGCEPCR